MLDTNPLNIMYIELNVNTCYSVQQSKMVQYKDRWCLSVASRECTIVRDLFPFHNYIYLFRWVVSLKDREYLSSVVQISSNIRARIQSDLSFSFSDQRIIMQLMSIPRLTEHISVSEWQFSPASNINLKLILSLLFELLFLSGNDCSTTWVTYSLMRGLGLTAFFQRRRWAPLFGWLNVTSC